MQGSNTAFLFGEQSATRGDQMMQRSDDEILFIWKLCAGTRMRDVIIPVIDSISYHADPDYRDAVMAGIHRIWAFETQNPVTVSARNYAYRDIKRFAATASMYGVPL